MVLSKKDYEKEIKTEADILLKDAYGNEIRQIGLLKAALVNRDGEGPLKTVEEAIEALEDFLWF